MRGGVERATTEDNRLSFSFDGLQPKRVFNLDAENMLESRGEQPARRIRCPANRYTILNKSQPWKLVVPSSAAQTDIRSLQHGRRKCEFSRTVGPKRKPSHRRFSK